MKSRFPKLTRIFLVLALMVGVVGSMVPVGNAKAITASFAVTVTPRTAGAVAVYNITPTLAAAVVAADQYTVLFPAGTVITNGVWAAGTLINGVAVTSATGVFATRIVTIVAAAGNAVAAGAIPFVLGNAVDITNPTTQGTANTLLLTKTVGGADAAATSAAFTISSSAVVSPASVNSAAQVTITGRIGSAAGNALNEDAGQFVVTFPSGTTVPATIPASSVIVGGTPASGNGTNAVPPSPPVVSSRTVTITTPIAYAVNAAVVIIFTSGSGILNPSAARTTYTVSLGTTSNATPQAAVASAAYTITPTVATSPTSGARSSAVTVTGKGYAANSSIDIRFATVVIASGASDASGNVSVAATVPSGAALGGNAVTITDGAGLASANRTFTVRSSLTLTPASGLAGSFVQITGSNWPASTLITVSISGAASISALQGPGGAAASTTAAGSVPTITGGAAANTVFQIAQGSTPGTKTIKVTVGTTVVTGTFTVTARALTISPTSGPVGTTVTITGTGMTSGGELDPLNVLSNVAGANGSLTIATVNWLPTATSVSIDAAGNFATSRVVGASNAANTATTTSAGARTITATDSGGRIATAVFTITRRAITLSPVSGAARSSVIVTGTGYPINSTVTLTWGGTSWGASQADSAGNFAFSAANLNNAANATATVLVVATGNSPASVALASNKTFSVPGAAMTLSSSTGAVGSQLTVTGTGFQGLSPLNAITVGGVQVHPGTTVVSSVSGNWSVTVTVPGIGAGATTVSTTLNVGGGAAVTRLFTVSAAPATVQSALAPLGTNLVRVWGFNAATQGYQLYDPNAAAASDLATLVRGGGYWINVTAAQTVVLGSSQYVLSAGWNLIGYLG